MNLERSTGILVCYNFISFNKLHCVITILCFVLLFLVFSFFFIIFYHFNFFYYLKFYSRFIFRCTVLIIQGVFRSPQLSWPKVGGSAYQFHPFNVYTPLESVEPLQHLLLVSLTVVNGMHTWPVNIYVYMYVCVMYISICIDTCFLSGQYHYPARLLLIVSLLSYLDFCCIICILCKY